MALFQALHFIGKMAQRREDHAPRQLGRGGIGSPATPTGATGGDDDAMLGAGGDIEVIRVASRLADKPEAGQALNRLTGQGYTLLREQQGVATRDLLDHSCRVGVSIGMDGDLVILESGVSTGPAQDIGVVMNHSDLHDGVPSHVSWVGRIHVGITPEARARQMHSP
jgi:hypothetical protein